MKRKRAIFLSALIVGLLVGVIVTARFNLLPTISADSKTNTAAQITPDKSPELPYAESLEGAFIRVAEEVGPAVVSISTEHVTKMIFLTGFSRTFLARYRSANLHSEALAQVL